MTHLVVMGLWLLGSCATSRRTPPPWRCGPGAPRPSPCTTGDCCTVGLRLGPSWADLARTVVLGPCPIYLVQEALIVAPVWALMT